MRSKLITFLVVAALVAAGVVAYPMIAGSDDDTYTVTADIDQAPNLFAGGRVMVRGVEIGEISDVTPHVDGVRVEMEISNDIEIPADAELAVVPITVISDRYVQFYPAYRSGPTLADGDHIGVDRTVIPAELDEVLAQLEGLLSALEPRRGERRGPLAKIINGLDEALVDRSDALAGTLEGGATVLENLARSDAQITGLIRNLDRVFIALANRSSELGLVNERFELVAEALAGDRADLEGTIENLGFLSGQTSQLIDESGESLAKSFRRLENVLGTVLEHQDALTQGIKWNNVIAQGLGATDASGRGRFAYTGRQAPPGTQRGLYNYRLETRDTITCERLQVVFNSLRAVIPGATQGDLRETLLSFIPDSHDEDLAWLLELLIPLCTDAPPGDPLGPAPASASVEGDPDAAVRRVAEQIGEERFKVLLARWFYGGFEEAGS